MTPLLVLKKILAASVDYLRFHSLERASVGLLSFVKVRLIRLCLETSQIKYVSILPFSFYCFNINYD